MIVCRVGRIVVRVMIIVVRVVIIVVGVLRTEVRVVIIGVGTAIEFMLSKEIGMKQESRRHEPTAVRAVPITGGRQ